MKGVELPGIVLLSAPIEKASAETVTTLSLIRGRALSTSTSGFVGVLGKIGHEGKER